VSEEPEARPDEETGPRCGERLAAAREEQQISVVEIAKELHLDEQKVLALEANDFAPLGAPVFAKGHLKKYAQLVKVEVNDILFDYHQLTRSEGPPPVVSNRKAPKIPASPAPWIATAVIILIVTAIAAWFFLLRPDMTLIAPDAEPVAPPADRALEDTERTTGRHQADAELADPSAALTDTATVPAGDSAEPVVDPAADSAVPEAGPVAATAPARTVAPGQLALELSFSGDCWTEITDGNGRRLFFDLGRAGRTVSVSGAAPFSVLLGNADNVRLQLNGVSMPIPDDDRRGQTARFTLSAP
jgi:cytoskeleton protein RodZ